MPHAFNSTAKGAQEMIDALLDSSLWNKLVLAISLLLGPYLLMWGLEGNSSAGRQRAFVYWHQEHPRSRSDDFGRWIEAYQKSNRAGFALGAFLVVISIFPLKMIASSWEPGTGPLIATILCAWLAGFAIGLALFFSIDRFMSDFRTARQIDLSLPRSFLLASVQLVVWAVVWLIAVFAFLMYGGSFL